MDVIDCLTASDCKIMDYVKDYQGEKIIIYGGAVGAKRVISFLEAHNIYPEYVVVDDNYYKAGVYIGKYEVQTLSKVLSNTKDIFDIIVAFGYYNPNNLEPYKAQIHKILDYEIFYGALEYGTISTVSKEYYVQNKMLLNQIYGLLEDELSQKSMVSYINQRISGEQRYSDGLVQNNQYFECNLIDFQNQSLFVDCGAFNGNDSRKFFALSSENSKAVVFEPDSYNMEIVKKNLSEYGNRVLYIEKGLLDTEKKVYFNEGDGSASSVSSSGTVELLCTTLDASLMDVDCKVSFIKMDIEGSELDALKGGEKIIKRDKPVLAICVYHKPEDIIDIPLYLKNLNLGYKFYMRRYDSHMIETVLYAV